MTKEEEGDVFAVPLGDDTYGFGQPVGSNQLYIYRAGQFTPAGVDDARHLEVLAFWFPAQRLQDHFAGRANRTFEFFKRIKNDPQTGQEIGSW